MRRKAIGDPADAEAIGRDAGAEILAQARRLPFSSGLGIG